ncbi:hypothetical protein ABZW18_17525 [Streptomyces sp. NPDC004647]|uniref:bestrophin-like domain n=1 Tax=Streptomyces sp. NPDC004647 TaxID=3154671 RepID=UPI0033A6A7A3
MPGWLVLIIAMSAACAVVVAIALLRPQRLGEDDDSSQTPDVLEYMTMMIGVVYAIVLGLAIAGVWEARGAAEDGVRTEAQALHEVSERAAVYPTAVRDKVRQDIDAYVGHVVNEEWPHMAETGTLTDHGTALLARVRHDVSGHVPRTDVESQMYQPMVDQVAAADDARHARAQNAAATMPGVVWFGLLTGALVTVGTIFTLQIRRSGRELMMAGVFSSLIAFLLFLIWQFDSPLGREAESVAPFLDLFPGAVASG